MRRVAHQDCPGNAVARSVTPTKIVDAPEAIWKFPAARDLLNNRVDRAHLRPGLFHRRTGLELFARHSNNPCPFPVRKRHAAPSEYPTADAPEIWKDARAPRWKQQRPIKLEAE